MTQDCLGPATLADLAHAGAQPFRLHEIIDAGNAPGELIVLDEREAGHPRAFRFMDAATGDLGDVLLEDVGYDFNGWLYRDPVTRNVVGAIRSQGTDGALVRRGVPGLARWTDSFLIGSSGCLAAMMPAKSSSSAPLPTGIPERING